MNRIFGRWIPIIVVIPLSAFPFGVAGQDPPARFQRQEELTELPVTVFHSTQTANLPTAESLEAGEWLVEISHRFLPPVSDGSDSFWGLDGPIYNRLGGKRQGGDYRELHVGEDPCGERRLPRGVQEDDRLQYLHGTPEVGLGWLPRHHSSDHVAEAGVIRRRIVHSP